LFATVDRLADQLDYPEDAFAHRSESRQSPADAETAPLPH
jgi:hypothetical protein